MLIGIDIARRDVSVILANAQGGAELALRTDLPKEGGAPAIWLAAMSAAREAMHRQQVIPDQIQCVAVALDAPIDESGIVGKHPRAVGWEGFDLPNALRQHLHVSRAAAQSRLLSEASGEWRFGALREAPGDSADWLYLHLGSSVGAVACVNGRIVRGANGAAGEIGALCIERDGALTSAGRRGGLESYCTHENFVSRAASYGLTNLTAAQIWDSYGSNFAAHSVCDDFMARLAQGTGAALTILNPAQLVFGGSLITALGEKLLAPLRARLKEFCLPSHFAHLPVTAGKLGNDAAALGAVALAMQNANPIPGPSP